MVVLSSCNATPDPRLTDFRVERPGVTAEYDKKTGRLARIEIDQNKNGRMDTWSYWDGTRLHRIEIDKDEDGRVDRWEHYDEKRKLTRVGGSSRGDAVEDTWAYPDAFDFLARVETDTDRDGIVDKRETFVPRVEAPNQRVLVLVELDIDKAGKAGQRLHYRADGSFDRAETVRR